MRELSGNFPATSSFKKISQECGRQKHLPHLITILSYYLGSASGTKAEEMTLWDLGGEHLTAVRCRPEQAVISCCKTALPKTNAHKLPQGFSSGVLGIAWWLFFQVKINGYLQIRHQSCISASARFAKHLSEEISKFVLPVAIYLNKHFLPQFPIKLNN